MAVVPGGCTKFLQPADVSWNKPFKGFLRSQYNEWLAIGEITYTKGGNPRQVSLELLCTWVIAAWESLSTELIKNSFKCCGISIALDGSEDNEISVFKQGRGCETGLQLLQEKQVEAIQLLEEDDYEVTKMFCEEEESDTEIVEAINSEVAWNVSDTDTDES